MWCWAESRLILFKGFASINYFLRDGHHFSAILNETNVSKQSFFFFLSPEYILSST